MLWIVIGLLILIVCLLGGGAVLGAIASIVIFGIAIVVFWQVIPGLITAWLVITVVAVGMLVIVGYMRGSLLKKLAESAQRAEAETRKAFLDSAEKLDVRLYRHPDGHYLVETVSGALRPYKTERGARTFLEKESRKSWR